jgi:nuclear pore complex protein Nup62
MQIIKEWTNELQERTSKFRKQAEALGEWDRRIITNRNLLIKLEVSISYKVF